MLSADQIYLLFPIVGAIIGAMLWLGYFKKIDMFEKERTIDICLAFIIGFLTPTLALWWYFGLEVLGFNFNGYFINDLLYSIFGVGLTEEGSKLIGVLIAFTLLKKRINEPIDYLLFAGVVALGFSVRENFIYYNNYGSKLITGRTLISSLVHIINASICIYGLYRYKLFNKGNRFVNGIVGIIAAIVSHGLFDFFLTQQFIGVFTPFLASAIYLVGINFWLQFFNNALNFSPYFSYDKINTNTKIYYSIFLWYAALLAVEFFYLWYYQSFKLASIDVVKNCFNEGLLLCIVALRISRLKINKRKYFPIKLQSPIYYTRNEDEDFNILGILPLKIRGENNYEFRFLNYMGKNIIVCPLYKDSTILKTEKSARLLKKYFLKNDVVTYLIEIHSDNNTHKQIFLLKPKTTAIKFLNEEIPVGTLYYYNDPSIFQKEQETLSFKTLKPLEEVYLRLEGI